MSLQDAIPRLLIRQSSKSSDTWAQAIHSAFALRKASRSPDTDVVLLGHSRKSINDPHLAHFLKSHFPTRRLAMRRQTMTSLEWLPEPSVILVCWATTELMDFVDGLTNVAGVVVVPRDLNSADDWGVRWRAEIRGEALAQPSRLIMDPMIERALNWLSREVNLASGLVEPYAKEQAEIMFRVLRYFDHHEEPKQVKDWAITHGWRPRDAIKLAKLAGKYLTLKTKPLFGRSVDPESRYRLWQSSSFAPSE